MITLERRGVVCEPNGDPLECEGVLNPAGARLRDGSFMLYPRVVAAGNVSRVGLFSVGEIATPAALPTVERAGYALEPATPYEIRMEAGGYGCEDPRVTFIAVLDAYVMAYTGYGAAGPRIALAVSADGITFTRLGLVVFAPELHQGADKDAAFFPEPVISPTGVLSLAMYHRPMTHTAPPVHPIDVAETILQLPPSARECVRLAYIPLEPVLADIRKLRYVSESVIAVEPAENYGRVKIGAGAAPVRTAQGWFSLYHGVDVVPAAAAGGAATVYTVGAVIHDLQRPHLLRYQSAEPLCAPETAAELRGTVDNVVFPTVLDERGQDAAGNLLFDVYYGMADTRIGLMRLTLDTAATLPANELDRL